MATLVVWVSVTECVKSRFFVAERRQLSFMRRTQCINVLLDCFHAFVIVILADALAAGEALKDFPDD